VLTEELLRTFSFGHHVKVANSGSGKMVIARYSIRYFFSKKSGAIANSTGKLARYCPALMIDRV